MFDSLCNALFLFLSDLLRVACRHHEHHEDGTRDQRGNDATRRIMIISVIDRAIVRWAERERRERDEDQDEESRQGEKRLVGATRCGRTAL